MIFKNKIIFSIIFLLVAGAVFYTAQNYFKTGEVKAAINDPVWNDVQPKSIYKEYVYIPPSNGWRVTDPASPYKCTLSDTNEPCDFPNLSFTINNVDKVGASKAELWLDRWGGHVGTIGHKVRFNNNTWRDIVISLVGITSGQKSQCYLYEDLIKVDIPLSDIVAGQNLFTFTSGNQDSSCQGSFNWGQWGWYVSKLRIFYGVSKAHPSGTITSPQTGTAISDNSVITVSANPSTGSSIERVEFYAQYYGYDENGDGNFYDIHRMYHGQTGTNNHNVIGHIGTRTAAPYSITWDTSWVPDQEAGGIAIFAKIKDSSGTWYVTEPARNITLNREGFSVKLYQPQNVPVNFWVRNGQTKSSKVNIPATHDLSKASAAKLFIRTWNAGNNEQGYTPMIINGNFYTGLTGSNHNFDNLVLNIPKTSLRNGDNILSFSSATAHHGCEIQWPGPAIMVRYGGSIVDDGILPPSSRSCHAYTNTTSIPASFGASWNTQSTAKEMLMKANCANASATFEIGNGSNYTFIYKYGYVFKDNKWSPIIYTGTPVTGSNVWFRGIANYTLLDLPPAGYFVAYVCQYINGTWKCGCRDQSCQTSDWQLQKFVK